MSTFASVSAFHVIGILTDFNKSVNRDTIGSLLNSISILKRASEAIQYSREIEHSKAEGEQSNSVVVGELMIVEEEKKDRKNGDNF